jgi:hypothetical protein
VAIGPIPTHEKLLSRFADKINEIIRGLADTGVGDMTKAVYDPTNVAGDVFDTDNHVDGTTNHVFTAVDDSKLAGIEALADVTDIGNIGSSVHGASTKATPVGADEALVLDSAASFAGKRSTLTELFAQAFAISTTTLLAVASELWTGTSTAKAVTPDALTDAHAIVTVNVATTTFTPDQSAGTNFLLTLADNSTLAMMSNLKPGRGGTIWVVQDGSGTNTLNTTAYLRATAFTVATGANDITILGYQTNQAGDDVALWLVGSDFV